MMKDEARVLKRKGRWGTTHFYIDGIPSLQGDYQITRNAFDTEQGAWDFLKGYDAAMSRTCEWEFKWVDRFNEPIYGPACDIEWSYERSTFCPNCGGRVVVKEAK